MSEKSIHPEITDSKVKRIFYLISKSLQERTPEEIHQLSLAIRKRIIDIRDTQIWKILVKSIQYLTLAQQDIKLQSTMWIYILQGSLEYHGMPYTTNQHMSINVNQYESIKLQQHSIYIVLTKQNYEKAEKQNEKKRINQQKRNTRKYIFKDIKIREKDYNIFWEGLVMKKLCKNSIFDLKEYDDDVIFIVFQGVLTVQYQWKRLIRVREIGPGSIFSSYLGRYVFIGKQQQRKQHRKIQFKYFVNQETIILGFNPDIFYEQQRFADYKFVVYNAWNTYLERVSEVTKIIKGIGTMRPQKQAVVKSIKLQLQEQQLRQRCISVPVAIQKRKFRKIIYNFFDEKSNRRKIPNLATHSARNLSSMSTIQVKTHQQENPKPYDIKFKLKTSRDKRSKTQQIKQDPIMRQSTINSGFFGRKTASSKTLLFSHQQIAQKALQNPSQITTAAFFKPEQFLSRKLRIQYEFICKQTQKLKLPKGNTEHHQSKKNFKNEKQYFENYVNERRIVKLGPKKRLLYKKKAGF